MAVRLCHHNPELQLDLWELGEAASESCRRIFKAHTLLSYHHQEWLQDGRRVALGTNILMQF